MPLNPATSSLLLAPAEPDIPLMPAGVQCRTLANGLTVIVREDPSAPVVSAQAWCQAGSVHEGRWIGAGLSHVLEHMLFKGTTTRGAGRIDQEVQEAGGSMNAYTSFDRTVYWINVPDTGGRVAVDILADIMQHATLPETELAKEMDVIRREMDMNQDDPGRRASRRLFETAYTRSPYRFTVIGYPDVFNELRREDIVGYYREKYAPNNVFFVVVGAVTAEAVFEQVAAAYAGTKARPLPPTVLPDEPRQMATRELMETAPIELGHVHWSWHIPDLRHPDVPALDVLATLLGSGRSSRLFNEVRERQGLVHSADAWTYCPGSAGLFGASAVVDADRFAAARVAILAEVDRLKSELIGQAELTKAVKQFVAMTLSARKTMQGQAQDLGSSWLAARDLSFSERYLAAVKRLTPAALQQAARTYLMADNRTEFALLPAGSQPTAIVTGQRLTENPIRKFELANGLRVLVKEDSRLPFVEFRAVCQGGVLAESKAQAGLSQLLSRTLLKGTNRRTAEQIANEIESVGGSLETFSGNNSLGLCQEVLSSDLGVGMDLLADVLLHPAFPSGPVEREREIQLAGLRAQRDQMLPSAFRLMRRALFGEAGYGLDPLGEEESVRGLTLADLQAHHQRLLVPGNMVLAVYGDVQCEAVRAGLEAAFTGWTGAVAAASEPPVAWAPSAREVFETRDKKQGVVVLAFPGLTLADPGRFALELLQEACSDMGSRLFLRIREQLGLAYYVGAQNFLGLRPGYFAFYAGTAPEKVEQVISELRAEAALLVSAGLTEAELWRAKAKVLGQKKIARQELGGFALSTALDELYGLGFGNYDHEGPAYESVTLAQVKAAAEACLQPDRSVLVVLRPVSGPAAPGP